MTDTLDELLDHPFHGAALRAFVEQSCEQQAWPCQQATRRRAFALYEHELATSPRNQVARSE